ncbi:GNAT family N-acetyltransferase [Streptomyces sp. B8F3]|uniref:GNAT family N-acetyltransferase n=1 Tax=Streptomyces sp. B8F3 TaxID=3153573 RepID=UPI00325CD588
MSVDLLTTGYYTAGHLDEIRGTLLDVYAEVYADDIANDPFFSIERWQERLAGHSSAGGWGCVIAEVDKRAAGFTYGFTSRSENTTFMVCENMLLPQWRGRGVSKLMHNELMRHRQEERAELLVRRERPRLRAMYERWGYQQVGEKLPFPDAPLYDVMVLQLP